MGSRAIRVVPHFHSAVCERLVDYCHIQGPKGYGMHRFRNSFQTSGSCYPQHHPPLDVSAYLGTRLLKPCGTVSTNIDTTYTQDVEGGFSELDGGRLHDLIR